MEGDPVVRALSGPDAAIFLAELTLYLTIGARGAYRGVDEIDAAKLRAANEILHAVSSKLIAVCKGVERFPSEAFLQSLREKAGSAFSEELDWAISQSLSVVSTKEK
jgi:hypothetical protein